MKLYNQEQAAIALGITPKALRWLVQKLSDEDQQRFIKRPNGKGGGIHRPWSTTTEGIEALRQAQRVVNQWDGGDKDKVIAEFRRSGNVSVAARAGCTYNGASIRSAAKLSGIPKSTAWDTLVRHGYHKPKAA